MTPFTDEDLKRLKDWIIRARADIRNVPINPERAYALLCRLETAERYLLTCPEGDDALYERWLETAGK